MDRPIIGGCSSEAPCMMALRLCLLLECCAKKAFVETTKTSKQTKVKPAKHILHKVVDVKVVTGRQLRFASLSCSE